MAEPLISVVDDDPSLRDALCELLASIGLEAQGFGSSNEVLESGFSDRPGCLIVDVRMPGTSGLELQQKLASQGDRRPILFLSGYGDVPMTVQAMKAGAVDFLTKPVREQTLIDAVMTALATDKRRRTEDIQRRQVVERVEALTPRERQLLRTVAQGFLNKQIAFELGISEITVKLHRGNMMRKMGARSMADIARVWELLPESTRASCA